MSQRRSSRTCKSDYRRPPPSPPVSSDDEDADDASPTRSDRCEQIQNTTTMDLSNFALTPARLHAVNQLTPMVPATASAMQGSADRSNNSPKHPGSTHCYATPHTKLQQILPNSTTGNDSIVHTPARTVMTRAPNHPGDAEPHILISEEDRRNSWSVYTPRQNGVVESRYQCPVCRIYFNNAIHKREHEERCRLQCNRTPLANFIANIARVHLLDDIRADSTLDEGSFQSQPGTYPIECCISRSEGDIHIHPPSASSPSSQLSESSPESSPSSSIVEHELLHSASNSSLQLGIDSSPQVEEPELQQPSLPSSTVECYESQQLHQQNSTVDFSKQDGEPQQHSLHPTVEDDVLQQSCQPNSTVERELPNSDPSSPPRLCCSFSPQVDEEQQLIQPTSPAGSKLPHSAPNTITYQSSSSNTSPQVDGSRFPWFENIRQTFSLGSPTEVEQTHSAPPSSASPVLNQPAQHSPQDSEDTSEETSTDSRTAESNTPSRPQQQNDSTYPNDAVNIIPTNGTPAETQPSTTSNRSKCPWCPRDFTQNGLGRHKRSCPSRPQEVSTDSQRLPQSQSSATESEPIGHLSGSESVSNPSFMWDDKPGVEFTQELEAANSKIVCYRQNLFKLPSGKAGKDFIRENTRLMRAWNSKSALKDIAWTCIMTMPALLLQKPSKDSKAKDHTEALKRRLVLWNNGNIQALLAECDTIQKRIRSSVPANSVEATSKKFATLMKQGKINAAVKLLTSSMDGGVLPLTDETMTLLRAKHPEPTPCSDEAIHEHQSPEVHPIVYESINAESVRKAALNTHGGAGPSGVDADGWRHMLVSRNFGVASEELRSEYANTIKLLCTEKVDHISTPQNSITSNIEALLGCRLIPLDKCPGLRPIGVGEVLRRIAGKAVMAVVKEDVQTSAGSLQVCAGQAGGCEAAIHGMRTVFEDEETDAILLIDAANAFNSINRDAMLKNIGRICPIAYVYAYNCYSIHARLFVLGGAELKSKEGTTQGDPTSMALYALGSLPLIWFLAQTESEVSQVAYADDLTGGGKVAGLREWFDAIADKGPLYGYHAEPTKSWLIVKEGKLDDAIAAFEGTGVNITVHGQKHLGAVIGNPSYKKDFVSKLVEKWVLEIKTLSDIAKFEPHAAYTAFTSCIRHRYTFYLRTIPDLGSLLQPLEDAISNLLIPALTEGRHVSADERVLLSLPPRLGGMGIIAPTRTCQQEFTFSKIATNMLTSAICEQQHDLPPNFTEQCKTTRAEIRSKRRADQSEVLEDLRSRMTPVESRTNDINCETGASIWLTTLPIEEKGFSLTKREFWDSVHLRYGWPLPRLPSKCACGETFNVAHALSCKKGGFVTQRHNELRDMTADLLSEVCRDVCVEPTLNQLTGETLSYRTANTAPDARLDVSARGVYTRNQRTFFDIRVFHPNARRFQGQSLKQTYVTNEKEKKRAYNQRVLEVENGTFTPLVFSVFGGMGEECKMFFKRLSSMLSEKRNEDLASVTTWVRTRIRFALLRSALMCMRGTRHRYYKPDLKETDMEIDIRESAIRSE